MQVLARRVIFVDLALAQIAALGATVAFMLGHPSQGLATYGYLALTTGTPLMVLVGRMDEGMSHLILLSVPLFVFLGLLIEMTGMARAMVAFLASLLGHVRGGLHYVLVGAMYLVSGISGSKAADMAAVAPVLFPEMKARGAKPGDLVALLSATGAQTETIPPSLVLITIGSVTGVSIAALFTGGLLPGVVLAITLSALVWWRYRHEDLSHVKRAGPGEGVPVVEVEAAAEAVGVGGERGGLPIAGFDLGNSPAEYTRERVAGKTVVFTTTNGTRAMKRCHAAHRVLVGAQPALRQARLMPSTNCSTTLGSSLPIAR